jgi:hypothetical protein
VPFTCDGLLIESGPGCSVATGLFKGIAYEKYHIEKSLYLVSDRINGVYRRACD